MGSPSNSFPHFFPLSFNPSIPHQQKKDTTSHFSTPLCLFYMQISDLFGFFS
jgi:hypothetical protein